jgi:hypothetical protein
MSLARPPIGIMPIMGMIMLIMGIDTFGDKQSTFLGIMVPE